jgi:hypothetical protein
MVRGFASPEIADASPFRRGDIVRTMDGRPLPGLAGLRQRLESAAGVVLLGVEHDGELRNVFLSAWPEGVEFAELLPEAPRRADALVLEDVPPFGWDTEESSTFLAALVHAVGRRGEPIDPMLLHGASGLAFRVQFREDWSLDALLPGEGFDCIAPAAAALGYGARRLAGTPLPDEAADLIRTGLQQGLPVLARGLDPSGRWGLITGIQQGGSELLCRLWRGAHAGYALAPQAPREIVVLRGPRREPSRRERIRATLRRLLELLTTEYRDGWWVGPEALRRWAEALRSFSELDPEQAAHAEEACRGNEALWQALIRERGHAVAYLRAAAGFLPDLESELSAMAAAYEEEQRLLRSLPLHAWEAETCLESGGWNPVRRERMARTLLQAREQELKVLETLQRIRTRLGQ